MTAGFSDIGAVVIGRNEGARLVACLEALKGRVACIVYVDSGSTDGSLAAAGTAGAEVVRLPDGEPFTAARARNAGLDRLGTEDLRYVQFIDGDCELRPDWLGGAREFLEAHPQVAVACGRRRERHPEASLWNRLIDAEWDTPVGPALACGGDALMRFKAVIAVGGYDPTLIAGEEPELCLRLRGAGWEVRRLDAEMTLHDAAMTRFSQWWQRCRRAGFAYAEGVAMHGRAPEHHNVGRLRRALFWGAVLPILVLIGAFFTPWVLLLALVWPAQVARLAWHGMGWIRAFFLMLGKFPEARGAADYLWRRLRRGPARLIEYK